VKSGPYFQKNEQKTKLSENVMPDLIRHPDGDALDSGSRLPLAGMTGWMGLFLAASPPHRASPEQIFKPS
jgi:hypothetical protein